MPVVDIFTALADQAERFRVSIEGADEVADRGVERLSQAAGHVQRLATALAAADPTLGGRVGGGGDGSVDGSSFSGGAGDTSRANRRELDAGRVIALEVGTGLKALEGAIRRTNGDVVGEVRKVVNELQRINSRTNNSTSDTNETSSFR